MYGDVICDNSSIKGGEMELYRSKVLRTIKIEMLIVIPGISTRKIIQK